MEKNKTTLILLILLIVSGIIIFFLLNRNGKLNVENNIMEQNAKALTDTIRITKNKVGDLVFSKNILISEKSQLENINSDLAKELKKEKGKVSELTKMVIKLKGERDTLYIPTTLIKYPDGTNGLKWDYVKIYNPENYRKISGISKFKIDTTGVIIPLITEITKDELKFNITQGLREKDGNIEVFVRSDYPGFEVEELNSVIIDPKNHPVVKKFTKKKKFGIGPYGGYGGTIINSQVFIGPQVGIGISYDLIQF